MTQFAIEGDHPMDQPPVVSHAIGAFKRGEVVVLVGGGSDQLSGDRRVAVVKATSESVELLNEVLGATPAPKLTLAVEAGTDPGLLHLGDAVTVVAAAAGGVLASANFVEAATDLAAIAQEQPFAILCDVSDGSDEAASVSGTEETITELLIEDLIRYRYRTEPLVKRVSEAMIPTKHGEFRSVVYQSTIDDQEHVAFVIGEVAGASEVLVRVHSECLTGDIFGSLRCDCGPQLDQALARISALGQGIVVYLRGHEGRGIGLGPKIRAYSLQDQGLDTVDANLHQGLPADARNYGVGALILTDLGVSSVQLLTNNPKKFAGLAGYGVELTGIVSHETAPTPENMAYLKTKKDRMGHILDLDAVGDNDGS